MWSRLSCDFLVQTGLLTILKGKRGTSASGPPVGVGVRCQAQNECGSRCEKNGATHMNMKNRLWYVQSIRVRVVECWGDSTLKGGGG